MPHWKHQLANGNCEPSRHKDHTKLSRTCHQTSLVLLLRTAGSGTQNAKNHEQQTRDSDNHSL